MFGKKSSAKKTSSTTKSTSKPAAKITASKKAKTVTKPQTQELAEYIRQKQPAEPEFQYIANDDHYDKVIDRIKDCKKNALDWHCRYQRLICKRRSWNQASP